MLLCNRHIDSLPENLTGEDLEQIRPILESRVHHRDVKATEKSANGGQTASTVVQRYDERFSGVLFADHQKRPVSMEEFQTLFRRCGPYLLELNLDGFRLYEALLFSILPMVPRVQHLHLSDLIESTNVLETLAKSLPELKSVVLKRLHTRFEAQLAKFVHQARKLEYLELAESTGSYFQLTGEAQQSASRLVYLRVDHTVTVTPDFLRHHPKLHTLSVQSVISRGQSAGRTADRALNKADRALDEADIALNSADMALDKAHMTLNKAEKPSTRLRYLHLHVPETQSDAHERAEKAFYELIPHLTSLEVLEITPSFEGKTFFSIGSLLMIANKCQRLQHLAIRSSTMGIVPLDYPAGHMMELLRLRSLKSLSLYGVEEDASWIDKFIISLAIVGILERLAITATIKVDVLCELIHRCPNLSFLYLPSLKKWDCERISATLNEIHSPLIEIDDVDFASPTTAPGGYQGLTIVVANELSFNPSSSVTTGAAKRRNRWLTVFARSDEKAREALRNPIREAIRLRGLSTPRA